MMRPMIKPAAPWVASGVFLFLLAVTLTDVVHVVAVVLGVAGTVLLSVGVHRMVQHLDRRAGYTYADAPAVGGTDRQAAARAALARARD